MKYDVITKKKYSGLASKS